jgi:hypothetical protein
MDATVRARFFHASAQPRDVPDFPELLLLVEKHPDKTFIGRIERGFWPRRRLPTSSRKHLGFMSKSAVSAATALEMYAR